MQACRHGVTFVKSGAEHPRECCSRSTGMERELLFKKSTVSPIPCVAARMCASSAGKSQKSTSMQQIHFCAGKRAIAEASAQSGRTRDLKMVGEHAVSERLSTHDLQVGRSTNVGGEIATSDVHWLRTRGGRECVCVPRWMTSSAGAISLG